MREKILEAQRVSPTKNLTSFVKGEGNTDKGDSTAGSGARPLAELFLDCTVIFADVSVE